MIPFTITEMLNHMLFFVLAQTIQYTETIQYIIRGQATQYADNIAVARCIRVFDRIHIRIFDGGRFSPGSTWSQSHLIYQNYAALRYWNAVLWSQVEKIKNRINNNDNLIRLMLFIHWRNWSVDGISSTVETQPSMRHHVLCVPRTRLSIHSGTNTIHTSVSVCSIILSLCWVFSLL